jgi:glycosyltransferase involved in cell wall biosynthesis
LDGSAAGEAAPRLSVVIPCKDDLRVVACVESIDAPAEVLVVSNGSSRSFHAAVDGRLAALGARLEVLPEANLARALEVGIRRAASQDVLLMDSDCVFEPGAVAAFASALAEGDPASRVLKGEIEFEPGAGWLGAIIARSRRQHTGRPLSAFKPPLAFSRAIAPAIGGYFFDERLRWKEDADLDRRVRRAGIRIVPVPGGRIRHAPLTPVSDLRSSFRYGTGAALAEAIGVEVTTPPRSPVETWRREGAATAIYMALANGVRTAGYVHTRLRLALGRERIARGSGPPGRGSESG